MVDLSKENIVKISNNTKFIKDNVEKVLRLIDLLEVLFSSKWSKKFVLKGGTAINLFYAQKRLSVDIDLDYIGTEQKEMLDDRKYINNFLTQIIYDKGYTISRVKNNHSLDSIEISYINNALNKDSIKIDINYSDRAHILPINYKKINALDYLGSVDIGILDKYELYGSKIAALLSRGKPRDVYDVYQMIENDLIDNKELLRECVIFYNCISGDADILEKNYKQFNNIPYCIYQRQLLPMLPKKNHFKSIEVTKKVTSFLDDIFHFRNNEVEFVNDFKERIYSPKKLFIEIDNAIRVLWHPMAYWKCGLTTQKSINEMNNNLLASKVMQKYRISQISVMSEREILERCLLYDNENKFLYLYTGINGKKDLNSLMEIFLIASNHNEKYTLDLISNSPISDKNMSKEELVEIIKNKNYTLKTNKYSKNKHNDKRLKNNIILENNSVKY